MAKRSSPRRPAEPPSKPAPARSGSRTQPSGGSAKAADRHDESHATGPRRRDGPRSRPDRSFPIVGVGASAGGLEAFTELLRPLTPDCGMAFVLVPHLDPGRESALVDLLSRVSKLPVSEVKDGTSVEPNHVYVIPPNTNMGVRGGVLCLTPRAETRGLYMPVDCFLRSLAEDQGNRAIGVVLSGSASDGTLGLKAIKAEGGITFSQDESAKYDGMPRSAIAAGCVDFVLPPHDIAHELVRIVRHPYLVHAEAVRTEELPPGELDHLNQIFRALHAATGVDFAHYKHSTLKRRMQRRMVLHKLDTLADYSDYMRGHPAEVEALYQDVLIHVTEFFRDAETFEALRTVVFPDLLKKKETDKPLRVWVPGCSTGEEVYSLAICLLEAPGDKAGAVPFKVFATDISEHALAKARAGVYRDNIAGEVSPERLRRFFIRVDGGYQISQSIRDSCIFAKQDLTRDPPFSNIDLISCRNVLIYLGSVLQRKVMPIFHYALSPSGYLLLGNAESMSTYSDLFALVDKKHNIYARKQTLGRPPLEFVAAGFEPRERAIVEHPVSVSAPGAFDVQKEADRVVLARYAPAGVVVDENMNVLQFRGHTGRFLEPPPGAASYDLIKMAREGLVLELRAAIHHAAKHGTAVRKEGLRVKTNDHFIRVNLEVLPITSTRTKTRYHIVLFQEVVEEAAPKAPRRGERARRTHQPAPQASQIAELQRELAATKEYLQSVIEELEVSNEELKSSNEEVLSSNEELQSTNEELETAKEELQATNEELGTVNEELQGRNAELTQLNSDLMNLLTSVNIPIVMLSRDLCIRRMTPSAQEPLNLIPSDVGRPITDIKPKVKVPDLGQLIRETVDNLTISERDVQDEDGRWYAMSVRPYRTLENKIDGAVISLSDVDTIKRSEATLRRNAAEHKRAEDRFRSLLEATPDAIVIANESGAMVLVNSQTEKMFGYDRDELLGKPVEALMPKRFRSRHPEHRRQYAAEPRSRPMGAAGMELFGLRKDGTEFPVEISLGPLDTDEGPMVSACIRDVTERREAEELLRQAERLAAIGEMVTGLAHESRNALQRSQASLEMLALKVQDRPEALVLLASVQQAQDHLHHLYEQVRNYAAPMRLDRQRYDLRRLVEQAWEHLAPALEGRRVRLSLAQCGLDTYCMLDQHFIEQVLVNIMENSLAACTDPVEITVAFSNAELDGRPAVRVTLHDNGPGLSKDAKDHVFNAFYTTKTHGTGLGMAIAERIIAAHGGRIAVGQDDRPGAEFTITLPRNAP